MAKKNKQDASNIAAQNRKARHNYFIEENLEAGIVLTGTEVKSLRNGRSSIEESYAADQKGELFLVNAYIPNMTQAPAINMKCADPEASACISGKWVDFQTPLRARA